MAVAGGYLAYRGVTGHCDVYSLAGKRKLPDTVKNINIRTMVTVNKPRNEVYSFWRKLSNLPLFMSHLKKVEVIDEKRSHWEAKIPGDVIKLEWDAEIVKEIEGELLGWNSLPHASIQNAGKVEFRDADESGTEIRVVITYRAPFGDVGEGITSLFNLFEKMIKNDVKNFKRYIENRRKSTSRKLENNRRDENYKHGQCYCCPCFCFMAIIKNLDRGVAF
jgi:uncharacterized membrane protein